MEVLRVWRHAVPANTENREFVVRCGATNGYRVELFWTDGEGTRRSVEGNWDLELQGAAYTAIRAFFRRNPGSY